MTTDPRPGPARRKPKAIEFGFLYGWHAILSGAFVVAYLSGDEDTYAMHQFAGYAVLAALAVRLIAAMLAPEGSPLRLRRPALAPVRNWISAIFGNGDQPIPRRPLLALAAVVLLIFVGVMVGSGGMADFVPRVEDLHGALGELAPWIVLAHVAMIAAIHRSGKRRAAGRGASLAKPSSLQRPWAGAKAAAMLATGLVCLSGAALAGDPARDAILAAYARQAKVEAPSFQGFSAARGEQLYVGPHTGGNPQTAACASCHTNDPSASGRNVKTGRPIEPMAVSANPWRFTDAADVEKRFARDCPSVLGRPCTAQEKGDFITFLSSR